MTSFKTIRDPVTDHLLSPQNAALLIIDFQPVQVASIQSRPKRELVANITALARVGKLYGLPTVLSTVNVKTGRNQPTIHQSTEVLDDLQPFDRTSINAWEDEHFVRAVRAMRKPRRNSRISCSLSKGIEALVAAAEKFIDGAPLSCLCNREPSGRRDLGRVRRSLSLGLCAYSIDQIFL